MFDVHSFLLREIVANLCDSCIVTIALYNHNINILLLLVLPSSSE